MADFLILAVEQSRERSALLWQRPSGVTDDLALAERVSGEKVKQCRWLYDHSSAVPVPVELAEALSIRVVPGELLESLIGLSRKRKELTNHVE